MSDVYWICLFGGLVFTVLTLLVGDLLDGVLDGLDGFDGLGEFLDPLSLVGGLTVFGGAGILFEETTAFGTGTAAGLAALIGVGLAVLMHFVYVKPMKRSENSTGFSIREDAEQRRGRRPQRARPPPPEARRLRRATPPRSAQTRSG